MNGEERKRKKENSGGRMNELMDGSIDGGMNE